MRPQLPATYNKARVHEVPVPPVHFSSIRCAENTDVETQEEEAEEESHFDFGNESQIDVEDESGQIEVKQEFPQVEVDDADASALDEIFSMDGDELDATEGSMDAAESGTQQRNETAPPTAPPTTTEKFDNSDDELEYTFSSAKDFMPYQSKDGYFLKMNDLLTDHYPFKLNVIIAFIAFQSIFACFI